MIGYFRSKQQLALEILNLKAELAEAKYQLTQQQKS
jgi:ribosomal protein L29